MFRFAVRAERAWSAVPAVVRSITVLIAIALLLVVSITSQSAVKIQPLPFRWS